MKKILTLFCLFFLFACNNKQSKIKVLGEKIVITKTAKGEEMYDTISAQAPQFCLFSHKGGEICSRQLNNKIYIVDFFFTHCPSICVAMKKNLLRVHDKFGENSGVEIVSISIDPVRDSVSVLNSYAQKLGVDNTNWNFFTGNKDSIYALAENFLALASEDSNSPGGFIHDGNFILVDSAGKIRGYYDGTDSKSVDILINDIGLLQTEKK
jgi:protein SCO1/2